ncbi:hypothetical protein N9L06_05325 [Mariniblastus sp.]|nr:hypothetical protein [Mariniblastus sp.]
MKTTPAENELFILLMGRPPQAGETIELVTPANQQQASKPAKRRAPKPRREYA